MAETLTPPIERRHVDYGVGYYLLAVTKTTTDNPPTDSSDLLTNPDTRPKITSLDEQMRLR